MFNLYVHFPRLCFDLFERFGHGRKHGEKNLEMQILQNEKRNQGQNWVKYIMGIIKHMSQIRTDNVMPPPPNPPPPKKEKKTTNQTKVHVSKHIIKCPVRKISRI